VTNEGDSRFPMAGQVRCKLRGTEGNRRPDTSPLQECQLLAMVISETCGQRKHPGTSSDYEICSESIRAEDHEPVPVRGQGAPAMDALELRTSPVCGESSWSERGTETHVSTVESVAAVGALDGK
jgi:hypothetical protein